MEFCDVKDIFLIMVSLIWVLTLKIHSKDENFKKNLSGKGGFDSWLRVAIVQNLLLGVPLYILICYLYLKMDILFYLVAESL